MLAVCQTFMNRARAVQQDIYRVAASYIDENPDGDFPDIRDPQFQNLISKIEAVLDGRVPDKTDGALWFVPKDKLVPNLLTPYKITTTIGNLVFCR
jgi:hypothetical protein